MSGVARRLRRLGLRGFSGRTQDGQAGECGWALSPAFRSAAPATGPGALRARIRRCRLPGWFSASVLKRVKEVGVRYVGLDVHRDFCEVAMLEAGRVRRGWTRGDHAEALAVFAAA